MIPRGWGIQVQCVKTRGVVQGGNVGNGMVVEVDIEMSREDLNRNKLEAWANGSWNRLKKKQEVNRLHTRWGNIENLLTNIHCQQVA